VIEVPGVDASLIDATRFRRYGWLAPIVRGLARLKLDQRVGRNLESVLRQNEDIRVLYFENYEYFSLARDFRRLRRTHPHLKLVVVSHVADFGGVSMDAVSRWYKRLVSRSFRRVLQDADGIVFTGETVRAKVFEQLRLRSELMKRTVIMQWPADGEDRRIDKLEARRRLGIPAGARVLLVAGSLRKDKRLDITIEAAGRARGDVWIAVMGLPTNVSSEEIREWIDRAGLSQRSRLHLAYYNDQEEIEYYSAADIFLHNSDSRFSNHQSGVLSSCRTYRLPAIVSDAGEIGDYVKRYGVGLACPPENTGAFAAAINRFFDDRSLQASIVAAIERVANQFTWENAVERLEQCFAQAIERPGSAGAKS
jgi:glycosyltransferase involved in cell wall biosynthesis